MGTYIVLKNSIVFSSINTVEFHPRRTMPTSLIVIDDFLPEPHTVRKSALELEYPELDAATPYAGLNSGRRIRIPGLDEEISRIVGERVVSTPNRSTRFAESHSPDRPGETRYTSIPDSGPAFCI